MAKFRGYRETWSGCRDQKLGLLGWRLQPSPKEPKTSMGTTVSPPKHSSSCQDTAPWGPGQAEVPIPPLGCIALQSGFTSSPRQPGSGAGAGLGKPAVSQNCRFAMETEGPQLTGLKKAVALLYLGLKRAAFLLPLLSLPSLPLATPPAKSHSREICQHKSLLLL